MVVNKNADDKHNCHHRRQKRMKTRRQYRYSMIDNRTLNVFHLLIKFCEAAFGRYFYLLLLPKHVICCLDVAVAVVQIYQNIVSRY